MVTTPSPLEYLAAFVVAFVLGAVSAQVMSNVLHKERNRHAAPMPQV